MFDEYINYAKKIKESLKDKSTESLKERLNNLKPKGFFKSAFYFIIHPKKYIEYEETLEALTERGIKLNS